MNSTLVLIRWSVMPRGVTAARTLVTLKSPSVTVATSLSHSVPSLICVPMYRYDPACIRDAVSLKTLMLSCVLGM